MEKDQYKKIQRINEVQKIISDLQYFHGTLDVYLEVPVQTESIINVKTEKSFSIFGSRYYGLGTRKSEIKVAPTIIKEIVNLTSKQIELYENELKELLRV